MEEGTLLRLSQCDRESTSQRLGDAEAQKVAESSVGWESNGRERERDKPVGRKEQAHVMGQCCKTAR